LKAEDQDRVEMVLKYIEDMDLRRWSLPDIRAFNVGIGEWRSKFNYVTNPYMFEEVCALDFSILFLSWIAVLVFRIRVVIVEIIYFIAIGLKLEDCYKMF
jgi:hypothetical protein